MSLFRGIWFSTSGNQEFLFRFLTKLKMNDSGRYLATNLKPKKCFVENCVCTLPTTKWLNSRKSKKSDPFLLGFYRIFLYIERLKYLQFLKIRSDGALVQSNKMGFNLDGWTWCYRDMSLISIMLYFQPSKMKLI